MLNGWLAIERRGCGQLVPDDGRHGMWRTEGGFYADGAAFQATPVATAALWGSGLARLPTGSPPSSRDSSGLVTQSDRPDRNSWCPTSFNSSRSPCRGARGCAPLAPSDDRRG